ncbi:ABC transporter substrate-binding protein, partial [Methylobacterium haplocladii]
MRVDLGYVPLTDAAPVLAAAELGFAREEGIDLVLSPEPSWATLRDRLALGHLDAAHMLAPLALATRL